MSSINNNIDLNRNDLNVSDAVQLHHLTPEEVVKEITDAISTLRSALTSLATIKSGNTNEIAQKTMSMLQNTVDNIEKQAKELAAQEKKRKTTTVLLDIFKVLGTVAAFATGNIALGASLVVMDVMTMTPAASKLSDAISSSLKKDGAKYPEIGGAILSSIIIGGVSGIATGGAIAAVGVEVSTSVAASGAEAGGEIAAEEGEEAGEEASDFASKVRMRGMPAVSQASSPIAIMATAQMLSSLSSSDFVSECFNATHTDPKNSAVTYINMAIGALSSLLNVCGGSLLAGAGALPANMSKAMSVGTAMVPAVGTGASSGFEAYSYTVSAGATKKMGSAMYEKSLIEQSNTANKNDLNKNKQFLDALLRETSNLIQVIDSISKEYDTSARALQQSR